MIEYGSRRARWLRDKSLIQNLFGKSLLGGDAKSRRISSGFLNSPLPKDFNISSGNGMKSKPLSLSFVSRDMKAENEVSFFDLIRKFNDQRIRYLIIGRRAIILYGGPVLTGDYDLWIDPIDKKRTLALLEDKLDFELSSPADTRRPIVTAFSGMRRYDLFFHRSVRNIERETIEFEKCFERSTLFESAAEGVSFRVPSIDDLIRLKKIRPANAKDEQDIEYLLKAKQLIKRKKL